MDFGANKTSIEVIEGGEFDVTYLKDIYSSANGRWYKKSWEEFNELKNVDSR